MSNFVRKNAIFLQNSVILEKFLKNFSKIFQNFLGFFENWEFSKNETNIIPVFLQNSIF